MVTHSSGLFGYSVRVQTLLLSPAITIILSMISIVGLFFSLPLFDLDEGAFSEATREMVTSGNWVSTYLNGEPRHDKPILIYWAQAISVKFFGISSFAFRLPSVIASAFWLWITYQFTREFLGNTRATLTVWIMSCSAVATIIFKSATADALLNLLLCASFFQIFRYCLSPSNSRLIFLGLIMGLGFLTKGPVAVALPVTTALITLLIWKRPDIWRKAVFNPYSLLPFVAVVLPWHIAIYVDQGWAFFQGFYLGHNLERFGSTMENHGGSPLYYLILLPFLLVPFTGPLLKLATDLIKSIVATGTAITRWQGSKEQTLPLLRTFLWTWFLLTLTLFSFSKTQLPHYLLYGLPPIFILLATTITQHHTQAKSESKPRTIPSPITRMDLCLGVVLAVPLIALPIALTFINVGDPTANYDDAILKTGKDYFLEHYQVATYLLVAVATAVSLIPLFSRLVRLILLASIFVVSINFITLPIVAFAQQGSVRDAAQIAKNTDANVVAFKINMPSFSVYAERIVPRINPSIGDWVFTRIDKLEALQQLNPSTNITTIYQGASIGLYQYGQTGSLAND